MEKVLCPQCGSEKIMALRGEYGKQLQAHECCCHDCDCIFLVSHMIQEKTNK